MTTTRTDFTGWTITGPAVLCGDCDREAWPFRLVYNAPRCSGCGSDNVSEGA